MKSGLLLRRGMTTLSLGAALVLASPIGAGASAQPVKIEKPQAWKGVSQVVIGQFSVVFLTKKIDYDGGGFLASGNSAKAIGQLSGVTNEDFLTITNAIYADFQKQLGQHGIAITNDAGFRADKYYAKVKPEEQGNNASVPLKKQDHADARVFWPEALGRNTNVILPLRMMDMNMGNAYTAEYNYARTSGTPVLNVVYYVDFAKPAKSDGGGLFQSIKVSAGLAISQFGTQLMLVGTDGKMTKMLLQTPIEEGGDFANVEDVTSGLTKVTRVASVLGAGVFGGSTGTMSSRFDYRVTNPADYAAKTQSAATKASDLFIRQMESLR
jgi:hypothetical protein